MRRSRSRRRGHGRARLKRRSDAEPHRRRQRRTRQVQRRQGEDIGSADYSEDDFGSMSGSPGRGTGVNAVPLRRGRRDLGRRDLDEEETEARVWILHSDCAKVIGRSGRQLREIEDRSKCRITVAKEDEMDPETKERAVDIIGTRRDQDRAVDLILELANFCRQDGGEVIKDARSVPPPMGAPGATEEEAARAARGDAPPRVIEVLPEEVGRVLGRKGETVKVIEKESRAKIELDKAAGRIEIFGTPSQQERAQKLLLEEVNFAKSADGTVLKDQPRPGQRPEGEELPPPMKLWVKDREAGRVIGRGGETVREVMEKSSADIKVQKGEDMAPGSHEREIKIIGTKDQQDEALRHILKEVVWARGENGMLKEPEAKPAETEGKETASSKKKGSERDSSEKKKDSSEKKAGRPDWRKGLGKGARPMAGAGTVTWVCQTCGGDHRTKECPHATGILGMGMQLGMQMGLQAMGLPGGGPPGGGLPGMPPPMGPPGMPPMGMGPPGMPLPPGMALPPGMGPPGMMALPGMPPMLPGMFKALKTRKNRRLASASSEESYSESEGSEEAEEPAEEEDDEEEEEGEPAPAAAAPVRLRRRVRKTPGADAAPPAAGPTSGAAPEPTRRRKRRREAPPEAPPEPLEPEPAEERAQRRRRRRRTAEDEGTVPGPTVKKKISMADL